MSNVLIVGEIDSGAASAETLELVSAARSISGDGGSVTVVFTGVPGIGTPSVPADSIYLIEHEALGESDSATFDAATNALTALVNEAHPDIILFPRSDAASVIAPRIAMRLDTSFARDCTSIETNGESFVVTRPVYGGNANARFRLNGTRPHVVMLRAGSYEPAAGTNTAPEPIQFNPITHIGDSQSILLRTVQEVQEGVRLEDADVVVSGGRGLGGPEPFTQIAELADLLGGAVGASRAACDAGWIDHSHQVGLTGKSVSPRLYLSFGISGASQHMAGCSSARNIVAVNTDPDASIFSDARFGVVGDWNKVLPALISALRDIG